MHPEPLHGGHLVDDPVYRLDPRRLVRVLLDLGPQAADVRVDAAEVDRLVLAPDQAQDVLAGEDLAGALRQAVEEVELEPGERDLLAADVDLVARRLQAEV